MKVLLDENLPHELRFHLPGHEVFTVAFMGWGGIENGKLLALAAGDQFDVLLILDGGIAYQQNIASLVCSVVVIESESNAMEHLHPSLGKILAVLAIIVPRTLHYVR